MPAVFVRKQAKDYGTCLAVEGGSVAGKRIVLIEDVITTGGAVADAARLVREAGAEVIGVVCAIWRGEGHVFLGWATMLRESTSQHAEEKVELLRSRYEEAESRLAVHYATAKAKVSAVAKRTDATIRTYPYEALTIALGYRMPGA